MRQSVVHGAWTRAVRLTGVLLAFICLGGAIAAPGALAAAPPSWTSPAAVDPSFSAQDFSCASSSLCVSLGQSGTVAGSSGQEFSVYTGTTWSPLAATSTLDPNALTALSCTPGTTYCVAADRNQGAITYSGGSWSAPVSTGGSITALSCPTTTFCIGVNPTSGEQSVFNGTSWTTSTGPTNSPTAVSCASTTLCVAIDGTQAAIYNGSTWGTPQTLVNASATSGQALTSVSCAPGTETCVAVDNAGNAYGYAPSTGVLTQSIDDGTPLTSVSCVAGAGSAVDCVALDEFGGALSTSAPTTSGSWSDPVSDELSPGSDAFVSCSSDSACDAVDTVTDSASAAGPTAGSWASGPTLGSGGFDAVSCAPDADEYDCVLADGTGHVVVIDGRSVSAPEDVDGDVALTTIACPSAAACLAGDANGNVITIPASASASSHALDPSSGIAAIACPSTSFCDALAYDGNDYTYNGSSWSSATSIDAATNGPDALSCASASFCVATDFAGNTFTFNGSSWSSATSVDPNDGLDAISCPTSSFCLTGDEAGGYTTFNGSSWSAVQADLSPAPIYAVDCTSANTCELGGTDGVENDTGGQFTQAVGDTADVTTISCSSTAFCMAGDDGGSVLFGAGVPANTGPPTISGTAAQGDTLTADPGTWVGSPDAYAYQWLACTASTQCSPISDATKSTYTIPQVTQAESFEVEVEAVNLVGASAPVTSAATAVASVLVPTNTTAPTVAGTAAVGQRLTAAHGTWDGVGTLTYRYQWYACAKTCTAVAEATTSTLAVTTADIGRSLAVVVYAANSAGSSKPAVSTETGLVAAPAATLTSWIAPLLHLTGSAGHLSKIKRAKDYPASFKAAIPGTVKVTWTLTEKIARTHRTKTVTVASATAKTTAPSTTVKVKLTKAGIALLKQLKTAKVKSTATFTYAYGTTTKSAKATRTLTLAH